MSILARILAFFRTKLEKPTKPAPSAPSKRRKKRRARNSRGGGAFKRIDIDSPLFRQLRD